MTKAIMLSKGKALKEEQKKFTKHRAFLLVISML